MPGFEQNEGTNIKLKSASRLEAERSEILNSGSTQHLKTLQTIAKQFFVNTKDLCDIYLTST